MKGVVETILGVALVLAVGRASSAQEINSEARAVSASTRVEVGAGAGALWFPYDGNGGEWFPSVRARVNVSPRFAIDVEAQFDPTSDRGVYGLYALQIHQGL